MILKGYKILDHVCTSTYMRYMLRYRYTNVPTNDANTDGILIRKDPVALIKK
jgi:hypothetical protein